jgi:hypothetical protein
MGDPLRLPEGFQEDRKEKELFRSFFIAVTFSFKRGSRNSDNPEIGTLRAVSDGGHPSSEGSFL